MIKTGTVYFLSCLRRFDQVIKNKDEFLRFIFITGVTKFAGVSVFLGLNNIEELESNFSKHIAAVAQKLQISKQDLLDKIKCFYNGYSWNGKETVYNPFSMLKFFDLG